MNKLLWTLQVLLALAFFAAGATKLSSTPEELVQQGMTWAAHVSPGLIKFIGVSEALGAVGLVAPAAIRIQPKLTPIAGFALALVMVLAAGKHIMLGEYPQIGTNLVLGGIAAFIGWGRLKRLPIEGS